MAIIALGSAILAICAWLTVPFSIPFTMQSFGVFLLLFVIGGKRASVSVLLYISLGALGVPVFAGFNSGLGALFGPSGGFLWGFAVAAGIYALFEKNAAQSRFARFAAVISGQIVCYVLGTAFYMVWCANGNGAVTLGYSLLVCVLPYVVPDCLKIALAFIVSKRLERVVRV